MLKLVVSLPYGQIEKRFEYSVNGRAAAYKYIKALNKDRHQVMFYKLTKIGV